MKQKWSNTWKAIGMEIREHKSSFLVYMTLRALVIISLILQLINQNYENVFLCILTLILLTVPSFIQVSFKVELPTGLEIIILLFIFSAQILGEIQAYYIRYPGWDTMLHTVNGFLAAAIGFSMVDLLNRHKKTSFNLSPAFLAIVAFCFSMTIGVLWEFFEYGMDIWLGFDMQKDTIISSINSVMLDPFMSNQVYSVRDITEVMVNGESLGLNGYLDIGLIDTMKDLFVNFIGAVVFSVIGYFYVKNRGKNKFINRFIPHLKSEESDFLKQVEKEVQKEEQREE